MQSETSETRSRPVKIGAFCAFVVLSMGIGSAWVLHKPVPTRWFDAPYTVDVGQLGVHDDVLEGQVVAFVSEIFHVQLNLVNDTLTFNVRDEILQVEILVKIENWSTFTTEDGRDVVEGDSHAIKGTCKVNSEGYVQCTNILHLDSKRTYIYSLIAAPTIVLLILYYFKINIKHISLVQRKKDASNSKTARVEPPRRISQPEVVNENA
ncbi:hypothetical protein GF325_16705 [Candidatus Bathyarchaeota archaeon]|nr:hypothetical protein [Candidatus Bathyarchaeota archaeon]